MHNAHFFKLIPDSANSTFDRIPYDIDSPLAWASHDALGYRKSDNCIYGVDYTHGPYTRLFKIDPAGIHTILDTLISDITYFLGITAGAITSDDRYLVLVRNMYYETGVTIGLGGFIDSTQPNLIYVIDLESPDYEMTILEGQTTTAPAGVRIGDLAFDPATGIGYAFDVFTNKIVTIDPFTGLIDNSSFASVPIFNEATGALMFTPFGELIGHQRRSEGESYVSFDIHTGQVNYTLIKNSPPSEIIDIDGCSCPYTVALEQVVSADTSFNCQYVEVSCRIAYWVEEGQGSLIFKDSFPPGFIIDEVLYNPYGGDVSGIGTSTLEINNFFPPLGIDSIVLRLFVPETVDPGTYSMQASISGLDLQAANDGRTVIFSDYPLSSIKPDPTPIAIIDLDNYLNATTFNICEGEEQELQPIIAPYQDQFIYSWFDGTTLPSISIDQSGTYGVTITNACESIPLEIPVNDASVQIDLGEEATLLAGEQLEIIPQVTSSSPISAYQWELLDTTLLSCLDCINPTISPIEEQTIVTLNLINELGCEASDELLIKVVRPIFAPNVFSPNRDGINDYFYLQTPETVSMISFKIFNRWGGLVFEKNDGWTNTPGDGWNGKVANKLAEQGIYVWQAELDYGTGTSYIVSGDVMVLF